MRTWRSSTNPAKREEHNLSALSVSEFSHNRLYIVGSNTRGEDDCAAAVGRFFFAKFGVHLDSRACGQAFKRLVCAEVFSGLKSQTDPCSDIKHPVATKHEGKKEGKERVFGWVVVWVVCKKGWPFFQ